MRAVLACLLVLCVCDAARADVFIPSDPPSPGPVRCAAAAGDVLAADVANAELRVSLAGGAWAALDGLTGCPVLAAAADGSAAVAGEARDTGDALLRVRVAGGAFGPPIALGPAYQEPVVAVAPGGWAAATWIEQATKLVVLIARPDGTTTRTVLDHGRLSSRTPVYLSAPRIAIDASGAATVVWQ